MGTKTPWHSVKSPWVHVLVVRDGESPEQAVVPTAGFSVTVVRGSKCKTREGLFVEFARALSFPDYFGHNWDAVEECLADLEWLPARGYVVIVTDAEQVLTKDDEDYPTFIDILNDAGESWSSRKVDGASQVGVPFHVVLVVSERHRSIRKNWLAPVVLQTELTDRTTKTKVAKSPSRKR
jgi:RNAse (barnase) inhibitor barstar